MMVLKFIKKATKRLGSDIAGGLDLLSAGFSHPILTVKDPLKAVELTREQGALQTSLRTARTTALAASALSPIRAAGVLSKIGVKASPKLIAAVPVLAGAASVSPKIRSAVDIATDPTTLFKGGQYIGEAVEGKFPSVTPSEALKTAGLIGGGIALAGAGVAVAKKIKSKKSEVESQINDISPQLLTPAPIAEAKELEVAEPIGAVREELPTTKETPKPFNINLNIRQPSNKIYLNNIIQSI